MTDENCVSENQFHGVGDSSSITDTMGGKIIRETGKVKSEVDMKVGKAGKSG